MNKEKIKSIIESILFVKGSPMSIGQLAKNIKVSKDKIEEAIKNLSDEYTKDNRGLIIIRKNNNVQIVTNPNNAEYIEKIVKKDLQNSLSRTALEALAIIAYRGPISRLEIEAIRGVNSSFILRNLLMRGLIIRKAKKANQRGYFYEISFDFLKKMGINNIKEIPDYEKLSRDERVDSVINIHSEK